MVFRTTDELLTAIGQDLRQLRKQAGLSQALLAQKAGISERALRNLESGQGSSLATFIGVLKALRQDSVLDALSRPAELSPMQLLRQRQHERGGHGQG